MSRRDGSYPRVRLGAALAFSLIVHTVLALVLGAPALRPPGSRSIAVTLIAGERGLVGGGGEETGGGSEARSRRGAEQPAPAQPAIDVAGLEARARARERARHDRAERRQPRRRRSGDGVHAGGTAKADTAESDGVNRMPGEGAAVDGAGDGAAGAGAGVGGSGGAGSGIGSGGAGSGSGDLRPRCERCPTPTYPPRARRQGWQGTVDVALHVGAGGSVEDAKVGRSSGFAVLDAAAIEVARRSHFRVAGATIVRGYLRYRFVLAARQDHPL